jgi:hypothetical protein
MLATTVTSHVIKKLCNICVNLFLNAIVSHPTYISGNVASDVHFQMYLLDGLARWNQDREAAVRATLNPDETRTPTGYSALTKTALNALSQAVLHKSIIAAPAKPMKYTGNLTDN